MRKMIAIAGVIVAITMWGCSGGGSPEASLTPEEEQYVRRIAQPATDSLLKSLKGALLQAIQEGGPVGAVKVCNLKALPLTDGVARQLERVAEVRRTSRKFRNPHNAPDPNDVKALEYFEEQIQSGKWPPYYIHKTTEKGQPVYFYYRPLKVAPLCLNCHGDPANMSPELVSTLKQLYPADRATGYREGDFRGLIRVKVLGEKG